jgi:hypothetical protein
MKRRYNEGSLDATETLQTAVLHALRSIGEPAALMDLQGDIEDATPALSTLCD